MMGLLWKIRALKVMIAVLGSLWSKKIAATRTTGTSIQEKPRGYGLQNWVEEMMLRQHLTSLKLQL
jgi:hypothetical protein